MYKPIVVIVGRPNVGKSTFFNRCIQQKHAIVDDTPGITRDRIYKDCDWSGHNFILVDTGGILPDEGRSFEPMAKEVLDQVKQALVEADVIVFMVDGREGITGADEEVANIIRRVKKPVILAVNKIDSIKENNSIMEFYGLGLGDPMPLSAMTGAGNVGDLLDAIIAYFPQNGKVAGKSKKKQFDYEEELEETEEKRDPATCPVSIAIVGRPNVGKSSITNVLCGQKRSIVADEPGTTRDAVDTKITYQGREITLVDTAGIRRKSRVDYGVEAFSVVRSLKALERADVVVLVLDASLEISDQDQKLASKIEEAGKAAIIVMNKWDLIQDRSSTTMNQFTDLIKRELRSLSYAEVLFTSATNKLRMNKIIEACLRAFSETSRRINTGLVNQILNEAVALSPPPASKRGKRLKVYYSTQVTTNPPTFVLKVSDAKLLSRPYQTYLERKLREAFGFAGSPLRIIARSKAEN
ncbi:MAG: ribosome biogenesis GTPase Der [Candidatus Melainabacteria bacterium]|jgi:GTP-binding protein|uniref:GTPase Der n=1 Tax=Candidatus Obscuribacter phosphatis TaxID=1906157 RepID=A0A8J7P8W8_9BACT|nr:ribosome biogenesis GTPase Der [Candidatus Obscuribacter phosphatis]MCA0314949.1 ribosome biogenesis GTPase Der [Candidatus Melainabacteria bacterium]